MTMSKPLRETTASATTPTDAPAAQRYLNVQQAAAYTGLSKSTLDKMRCYGTGPKYSRATRRRVVYDRFELDDYLNANKHRSTSEYHSRREVGAVDGSGSKKER